MIAKAPGFPLEVGMRRTTPGNVDSTQLLPDRVKQAESHAPAEVIRKLEPLVLERRCERIKAVLARRLDSVTVVFDSPYDPHNGAAIIRSCEAFGVQRLHVIERTITFLAAPSVTRGAEKWIDVCSHTAADTVLAELHASGHTLVAAHPEGELLPEELARIPRVALVMGNERYGVGPDIMSACSARVRVPMRGFIESLNVSVTAAILLASATSGREGDLSEMELQRLYARGLFFSVEQAEMVLAELG